MSRLMLLAIPFGLVACSDDANSHKDATTGDGPCGNDLFFTGELVDFGSSDALFCGVFNANMHVHGDTTRTDMTNPNGRFELCLKQADQTQVDVTPPMSSECVSGTYAIPGIAIANKAVIATGALFSARSITDVETTQLGLTFDPAKGYLFVHVVGTPRAVSISSTHDASIAFNPGAWAAGDTGEDVLFPNTDIGAGTTTLQVSGGAVGTGSVSVVAGTFTYVTISSN